MKRIFALAALMFSVVVFAQAPQIKRGSTVYIEPMGGDETYLAAALAKKQAPLILVTDKGKADFIITISQPVPDPPLAAFNRNDWDSTTSRNISVIDARSSQKLFASTVTMRGNDRIQSADESFAKRLKVFIDKQE
jgi:hypothetical protein